jgi:hypothetical protein
MIDVITGKEFIEEFEKFECETRPACDHLGKNVGAVPDILDGDTVDWTELERVDTANWFHRRDLLHSIEAQRVYQGGILMHRRYSFDVVVNTIFAILQIATKLH